MGCRQVWLRCPSVASDRETVSQANPCSGDSVEVLSVGWADFEEDLRDGEGGPNGTAGDSIESCGPRNRHAPSGSQLVC